MFFILFFFFFSPFFFFFSGNKETCKQKFIAQIPLACFSALQQFAVTKNSSPELANSKIQSHIWEVT